MLDGNGHTCTPIERIAFSFRCVLFDSDLNVVEKILEKACSSPHEVRVRVTVGDVAVSQSEREKRKEKKKEILALFTIP